MTRGSSFNKLTLYDRGDRKWVNPYRLRIHDFPGRVFCFDDWQRDREAIRAIIEHRKTFCEIGSGSGRHLLELGVREPNAVFFGFELRFKRTVRTIEKALAAGIKNVYVLRINALHMAELFPQESIEGLYLNFPDPWVKRRSRKHRLLTKDLLTTGVQLLKPSGFISVKTDHQEYFSSFLELLRKDLRYEIDIETKDVYSSNYLADNVSTEFEQLFCSKSIAVCWVRCRLCN